MPLPPGGHGISPILKMRLLNLKGVKRLVHHPGSGKEAWELEPWSPKFFHSGSNLSIPGLR